MGRHLPHDTARNARFFIGIVNAAKMGILSAGQHLPIRDHARRHIAECIRLSKLPGLADLRLAAWAHMLGFRGHFSTKSRTYSTTLGALRADRATHQREFAIAAGLQPDLGSGTTLVMADWHFAGRELPPVNKGLRREGVGDVA